MVRAQPPKRLGALGVRLEPDTEEELLRAVKVRPRHHHWSALGPPTLKTSVPILMIPVYDRLPYDYGRNTDPCPIRSPSPFCRSLTARIVGPLHFAPWKRSLVSALHNRATGHSGHCYEHETKTGEKTSHCNLHLFSKHVSQRH